MSLVALLGCAGNTGTPNVPAQSSSTVAPSADFAALVPTLLAPTKDTPLNYYPRLLMLRWRAEPAAAHYVVDVEIQGTATLEWVLIPNAAREAVTADSIQIEFIGANPGRWRVTAIDSMGVASRPSEWWGFVFVR